MQKKFLTLAVASALAAPGLALAQSSVEVYGDIHMVFGHWNYGQSTAGAGSTTKWDVANGASNYGLRGRESVGGGMTAWFQVEQNAPLERSNNQAMKPASRNSAIGLQSAWGNVFVGQWTTPWADLDGLWNVGTVGPWGPVTSIIGRRETTGSAPNYNCGNLLGAPGGNFGTTAAGNGVAAGAVGGANSIVPTITTTSGSAVCDTITSGGGVGHAFWRRISNAVFYQSPVFSGVQFKFAAQTNEGRSSANANTAGVSALTTTANPSMWSSSLQWAGMGGRARVGLAIDRHKDFTTIGQTDSGYSVKGGYDFGVINIGLAFERMTYKIAAGDSRARQWGIAADFPMGTGSIKGAYSSANDLTSAAGSAAKQYNLGYEHRFSKRTNVGVGYAKVNNDSAAQFTWSGAPPNQAGASNTPLAGSDVATIFVSMRHRF
jgi:predicted porin